MVIKLYISGISGNKEVKKKQQRVQMILDSKQINYEAIDITEPGKEKDKEFMQQNGKVRESLGKHPLPPQIFNDEDFCGDYEDFDMANEVDELEKFLHIETNSKDLENDKQSDDSKSVSEGSINFDQKSNSSFDPYEYHTFKIRWDNVNGLQERIITDLVGENEQSEEIVKSEVNGESEAIATSEPSSENIAEKEPELSAEEVPGPAPDKEEVLSAEDSKTGEEKTEEEKEDNEVEEKDQQEVEAEVEEKNSEEEVENPEDKTATGDQNNEESPHDEEKEGEVENLEKEDKEETEESEKEEEEEKEEKESGDESPQSEKSQED